MDKNKKAELEDISIYTITDPKIEITKEKNNPDVDKTHHRRASHTHHDDLGFLPAVIKEVNVLNELVLEARRSSIISNTTTVLSEEEIIEIEKDKEKHKDWADLSRNQRILYITLSVFKGLLAILFLYIFLLSLSFMSIGFTLVTSYALQAGDVIRFLLKNPFASLSIGIIATAFMQNATATTSIAVIMVGAGIIPDVKSAVPIIMGANIGTCVTNSFIALTLARHPEEFKRAFSAATLNDGFNLMTTAVLLPIEILTGFLYTVSHKLTDAFPLSNAAAIAQINFMSGILNPVTNLFILLNETSVDLLSKGNKDLKNVALRCCELDVEKNKCVKECAYWCMPMLRAFGDGGTGLFWILFSLFVLLASLFAIVKVFSLLIVGPIAKGVTKALNLSFPGRFKWLTQLILFVIAIFSTIVVQSSNIITATLVPLCGIGIISLQKVFVMTLGSNIGTTVTGILTAFTQPPSAVKKALQLAIVYTFFNTLGVIFWLPIPYLRFPKTYAKKLGEIVFNYRWFLYAYILCLFFIFPLIVFGLALIPFWIGLSVLLFLLVVFFIPLIEIKLLQVKFPNLLPDDLKNFNKLPIWLRSLNPYDEKLNQWKSSCKNKFSKKHSNSTNNLV